MERTLIILKPDAVQRALSGEIIKRFEQRGLKVVAMKMMHAGRDLAEEHYAEHKGKGFYEGLVSYITSQPVIVIALEGNGAIAAARQTIGSTKPLEATPGTIRGDFALEVGRNLVHGSDGSEAAQRELALWFAESDFAPHGRISDAWVYEESPA